MMLGRRDLVELPLKHGAVILKRSHETISKEFILEMEKTQTLTPVLQFIFLIIVCVFSPPPGQGVCLTASTSTTPVSGLFTTSY